MANKVEHSQWDNEFRVSFYCAGCGQLHAPEVTGPRAWQWNGSLDKPTLTPSILARFGSRKNPQVCHSYVTDGVMQFLGDCTHELAGQAVAMADIED